MSVFFFKSRLKQLLRMCGHAFSITLHERMDVMDKQIGSIIEQNTSLARTQTALLQSSAYLVTTLQGIQKESQHDQDARIREALDQVTALQRQLQQVLDGRLLRQVSVEADDYAFANPEVGLMAFLYSYLPSRKALDVGAHVGNVSERLLKVGYEVFAFEPYAPTYKKLVSRLGENKAFHHFNIALSRAEAELPLHIATDRSPTGRHHDITQFSSIPLHSMPDDLPFAETVLVPAKPLAALQPDKVPADLGLVKIDTEGYDLEVIRGMGDRRYPVIAVEFWDTRMPFGASGLLYTLDSMVNEMRSRGYSWHIVLYRVYGGDEVAFYCNHDQPIPASWGNIFFFREHATFIHAEAWCAAALPRTYFKPSPGN